MTFGDGKVTQEDREKLEIALTQIFYRYYDEMKKRNEEKVDLNFSGCCYMWDYLWKYENILEKIYEEFDTYDSFEITRYLDIPIEYRPISQLLAKITYLFNQPIIIISDELQNSNSKYFVCAHELGHIFKHTVLLVHMMIILTLGLLCNEMPIYLDLNFASRSKLKNMGNNQKTFIN